MYLSDLIRDIVTQKLQETCTGHTVTFCDLNSGNEKTIFCTHTEFTDDDGYCWIKFTDDKGQEFMTDTDQGIDIWFEVKD